jgi:hypothetical protein
MPSVKKMFKAFEKAEESEKEELVQQTAPPSRFMLNWKKRSSTRPHARA